MQICNSVDGLNLKNPVITIGSFDGLHLGHRKVIQQLKELAAEVNGVSVVITFWPHPSKVLSPQKEITLLATPDERDQLFAETGIDYLIVLPFTKEFSQIGYNDFVTEFLVKKLKAHAFLLGYDNKIGHGGKGNFQQIQDLADKHNFRVEKLTALKFGDEQVSSTRIRDLLSRGDIPGANKLLGYHFGMNGTVVYGQRLGTSLGFPTANIMPHADKFIPGVGVYAIRGYFDGQLFNGMMNIGYRPTVSKEDQKLVLEAHLFNFDENIYDKDLKIEFVQKMRDEKSFKSIDELRAQLQQDKVIAKHILT